MNHHQPDEAAAIQQRIRQVRRELLQGHGPGGSMIEIDRHTRARIELAGQPVPQALQETAEAAAHLRGDPTALVQAIARHQQHAQADLQLIRSRLRPVTQARMVLNGWSIRALVPAIGVAAAVACQKRRHHRLHWQQPRRRRQTG